MNDLIAKPFIMDDTKPPHEDFEQVGHARYYHRLQQGSAEWLQMRLGMITASEMDKILTPATLKIANNEKTRTQLFELAAQRITEYVDPHYVSFDMERGKLEEVDARVEYARLYEPVQECGFIINDSLGFDIGFSPDALVGKDGFIEIKSRVAKYQVKTIIEHIADEEPAHPIPVDFMLQCQTGLFVTKRKWCDFVSYSNGLNMLVIRTYPIPTYQTAIAAAAKSANIKISAMLQKYGHAISADTSRVSPVARADYSGEIAL